MTAGKILAVLMVAFFGLVFLVNFGATVEDSAQEAQEGVTAKGILSLPLNPSDTETVTIDGKVYTYQTTLTNVNGNVLIGAAATDSRDNLVCAIRLRGCTSGTDYAAAMTEHTTVTARASGANLLGEAKTGGTAGNSLAVSETLLGAGNAWDDTTLGTHEAGTAPTVSNTTVRTFLGLSAWVVPVGLGFAVMMLVFRQFQRRKV